MSDSRIALLAVGFAVGLVIYGFYARTLYLALRRSEPERRPSSFIPVWLVAVPYLQLIAHPFVVADLSRSLRLRWPEGAAGLPQKVPSMRSGQLVSLAFLVCYLYELLANLYPVSQWSAALTFPVAAIVFACVMVWISYWRTIARLSATLAGTAANVGAD